MTVGYDLDRIRVLSRRTLDSIESSRRVRSSDPAAADALRAVRLLRQNLEDHWMPALFDIERSEAMVSWRRAEVLEHERHGDVGMSGRNADCVWTPLSPFSDDELIEHLRRMDRLRPAPPDPPPTRFEEDLDTLAGEMALRVGRDRHFADRLVGLAAEHPLVGSLTARAEFPTSFVSAVVTAMMWPHGPTGTADLDHFAEALSTAISALVDDPGVCLDLLLDPVVLHGIASWERLDVDVVTEFVVSGLHTAVATEPRRLADGYRVLADLTELTNGPLDHGLRPGMALGVAASMIGYIDTLAPAIRQEGSYPVLVVGDHLDVELGTYDEVVDLFGAVLRDRAAQAALGTVLGGYVTSIVTDLGADIVVRPGLQYVTGFADLIADASRTEQAELVMEAAAEEAQRRWTGGAIGFAVTLPLAISGVGSAPRAVASRAIALATSVLAPVEPRDLPDTRIPSRTYDLITVVAISVVAGDPTERQRAGLAAIDRTSWDEITRRLGEIEEEDDVEQRTRRILQLDHWIEAKVPLLAGYLGRIRSAPGMAELTEARTAVNED